MTAERGRASEIQAAIGEILLTHWDPIGIREIASARDEYDSYVAGVYRRLTSCVSPTTMAEHLASIESETMGLSARPLVDLLPVAHKLCALDVGIMPSEHHMDPGLAKIIGFLNQKRVRATYGAVGEVIGVPARTVGEMLGARRPEVSWVVNADTGEPTGYATEQKHPALHSNPEMITSGLDLLRRIADIEPPSDAR